jgi:hypothetical protein
MTTATDTRRHSCGYLLTAPSHAGLCRDDWGQYTPDPDPAPPAARFSSGTVTSGPNEPRRWGDPQWASQRYRELTGTAEQRDRIRAWGRRHSIPVSARGQLLRGLVRAYDLDDPAEF